MSVRYILQDIQTAEILDWDMPLQGVQINIARSAPTTMKATVTHERPLLVGKLVEYDVAIWVDDGTGELYGGMLTDVSADGPRIDLTVNGYAAYPQGQPWTAAEFKGIQVDPLDVLRMIWARLQGLPGGNLNLAVDATTSPHLIGEEEKDVSFNTSSGDSVDFAAGPYTLNYWGTADLGKEQADLISKAGASYIERHYWDGDTIKHRLQIDYPARAVRRDDLRLVLGESVIANPKLSITGSNYASSVLVLGAGQGSEAIYASADGAPTRLRRTVTVSDKSITTKRAAADRARAELEARSSNAPNIDTLTVLDTPMLDFRTVNVGDVVRVTGETSWLALDHYVVITDKSWSPEQPQTGELGIAVLSYAA